jgi:hypothetical protein
MLTSDYDLRQRQLALVTFNNPQDALTAPLTRTIPIGFQTRIVLVVGTCTATLGLNIPPRVYGGGVSAFADLESNPTNLLNGQRGFGISITRFSNTDWFSRPLDVDGIGGAIFTNNEVNPPQGESFSVAITSVSATAIEATLTRNLTAPTNARLPGFAINLKLLCMG